MSLTDKYSLIGDLTSEARSQHKAAITTENESDTSSDRSAEDSEEGEEELQEDN